MEKHRTDPLTALVIDDGLIPLIAQARLLAQFGFHVVTANNAVDAFEILEHSMVDFVLTDIEMPDIRGDELAYLIHKKFPKLPVIAITSGNLIELALNEKARFHKILTKPLTQEKVSFLSLKQQKEKCMTPTRIKVVEGPNGKRVFLGSAFPGVYFTPREAELAIFLGDYKYREIAAIMKVSSRTTEYYSTNMKKKLHCSNKRHLVYVLKHSGLLDQLKAVIDIGYLFDKDCANNND